MIHVWIWFFCDVRKLVCLLDNIHSLSNCGDVREMRWMRLNLELNFCLNPSSLWEWEWNSLKIDIVWLILHDFSVWFDEWKWIVSSAMKKERDYKIRVCEPSWMFLPFNFRQIHLLNKCTPLVLVAVIEQYLVMTTEIFWNERNVCPKETSTLSFSFSFSFSFPKYRTWKLWMIDNIFSSNSI
jgi:hypothetical protein